MQSLGGPREYARPTYGLTWPRCFLQILRMTSRLFFIYTNPAPRRPRVRIRINTITATTIISSDTAMAASILPTLSSRKTVVGKHLGAQPRRAGENQDRAEFAEGARPGQGCRRQQAAPRFGHGDAPEGLRAGAAERHRHLFGARRNLLEGDAHGPHRERRRHRELGQDHARHRIGHRENVPLKNHCPAASETKSASSSRSPTAAARSGCPAAHRATPCPENCVRASR